MNIELNKFQNARYVIDPVTLPTIVFSLLDLIVPNTEHMQEHTNSCTRKRKHKATQTHMEEHIVQCAYTHTALYR